MQIRHLPRHCCPVLDNVGNIRLASLEYYTMSMVTTQSATPTPRHRHRHSHRQSGDSQSVTLTLTTVDTGHNHSNMLRSNHVVQIVFSSFPVVKTVPITFLLGISHLHHWRSRDTFADSICTTGKKMASGKEILHDKYR